MRRTGAMAVWVSLVAGLAITGGAASAASNPDKGVAQAGVLTLQDFPNGWAPKPRSPSSSFPSSIFSKIPVCRQFEVLLANSKTGTHADSRSDFTDGRVTVDNGVVVYPDVAHALKPFTAAKGTALSNCLQQLLKNAIGAELAKKGLSSSVQHLAVVSEPASSGVTAGDDQTAIALTVTFTARGISQSLYVKLVIVRVGRALDTFDFENDTSPITVTLPAVLGASVTRLQAALGLPTRAVTS